jgi:beta-phosphoglucomutase
MKPGERARSVSRDAVIFDVDGVLVDSYAPHLESWLQLGRETGVAFTEADFARTFGQTSRDIIGRFWHARATSDEATRDLDELKEQIYRDLVATRFPAMEGATALVEALHKGGLVLAVGSSGPPENVNLAIDRLGVRGFIDVVITGRDVRRGKPDPEIFLLAARRMNVPAARCVVIEDAPPGIEAARAAGMVPVCLLSQGHYRDDFVEHPPAVFVERLRELTPSRIRALLDDNKRQR